MINLIPNEEKKRYSKDFYLRLVAVIFFALGICFLLITTAIVPSYFSSVVRENIANEHIENQKSVPIPEINQEALAIIDGINGQLTVIENASKSDFVVSTRAINEVVLSKDLDIRITRIFYEADATKGKKINISGRAPSREALLLFRRSLEANSAFSSIDLPISNFVKGANIEFNLTAIPS